MNSVTLSSANRSATACEQRDVFRALEDLKEQERTMYEIDNRKDQVMTVCKMALANLAMWVRDHYFPPSYAQATWKRLLPFFQLPGTIPSHRTPLWFRSNCARSTTACSIETWSSYVTASIRRHLACPIGAASRSPSGPLVAFLLRRKWEKYRDSLFISKEPQDYELRRSTKKLSPERM